MVDRCSASTQGGAPCNAQVWQDNLCRWHHPDLAEERAAWRRRGGEGRSTASRVHRRLPKTLLDVQGALLRALAAVEAGELEPARANAMAGLARALVLVTEYATLEQRIAALEQAAGLDAGRGA